MSTELALIPIDDLIEEIYRRKEAVAIAFIDYDNGVKTYRTDWSGDYLLLAGLSNALNNDVVNIPNHVDEDEEELDYD